MKIPPDFRDRDVHVFRRRMELERRHAWVVFRRGCILAAAWVQREAIGLGRTAAVKHRCDLVVHGRDGRIRSKDSFGRDPRRRKG